MALCTAVMLFATSCSKADDDNPNPDDDANGFEHADLSLLATQWDDGWVSHIKDNWTEVAKGQLKIYIFHPNQQADAYHSNLAEGNDHAASILVVPHFSNITSVQDRGIQSFESITFLTADAMDNETGKPVHLVFFKKHYGTGNGRYMLVVADSKSAFENEFGNNYINSSSWDYMDQINSWNKLANMQWRNRFALSSDLLTGTWSSGNTSTLSYYYANGGYAGATGVAVADKFRFFSGNQYESDHSGASGMIGDMQFSHVEYQGSYTIQNSWKIQFTNRFQGDTEVFDSYFEAIASGLLLVLVDRNNTVTTLAKH
ncbi:hypothetical protein GCM10011386_30200 [Parapedobacter defluvii]|uniref:Uncharacterized protein n=2 Tax=Parapedobacter defluvii TaxID=2045106 RepID=A0ABQ1M750_9SPHI|nr:hypothetical protein GCM10011386_30200 [Parapedobacter defluvii]